jgi:hypothetical protein
MSKAYIPLGSPSTRDCEGEKKRKENKLFYVCLVMWREWKEIKENKKNVLVTFEENFLDYHFPFPFLFLWL